MVTKISMTSLAMFLAISLTPSFVYAGEEAADWFAGLTCSEGDDGVRYCNPGAPL